MISKSIIFLHVYLACVLGDARPPRVAVVGAGIGGTMAAYHLSLQLPEADITIFEPGPIGGRLATRIIADKEYEVGGSIIHPANRFMVNNLAICGLEMADSHESGSFNIISGGQVVFSESDSFMSKVQMIARYGLWSLLKLENFVENLLDCFSNIYPKLDEGYAAETVSDLLDEMSPVSKTGENSHEMILLTKMSIAEKLRSLGISEELIEELAMIAMKVNYNAFPENIHAFVGSVSMAGIQPGLWRVKGGNYKVPECLLEKSKGRLLRSKVDSITLGDNSQYTVRFGEASEVFDVVVIATPLTKDKADLKLHGLSKEPSFPGSYQRTLAYLVHGSLNHSAYGLDESLRIDNNFFIDRDDPVSSLSLLTPVDFNPDTDDPNSIPEVYKIFSRVELSSDDLAKYFSVIHSSLVVDWLAYPDYKTYPGLGSFKLHENLYYVNNIEWSASAMEMSALAAKNVVNLITNKEKSAANKLSVDNKVEL